MNEHVIDELDAYALGALDNASAERIAAHLATCPGCRREASALAEVVGSIPEMVPLREPRAALRDRVLAAARTDAAVKRPDTRRGWSLGPVRWPRLALAGLTAAVVVLGAVDLSAYTQLQKATADRDAYYSTIEAFRQGGRIWYMAGKDSFAGAGGTLIDPRAQGKQPFVLFHDLPPVAAGKILTIWLVSPDSTWARAATFVPNGSDIQAVQISMEVAGFDRCAVTLEDSAWGAPRGPVVMESRIAPTPGG
jgi:anti-sigma-K factor RskA/putative zinc finger protein